MNTGLQDAHNLAWKLGLVMNKLAPASLLQSYQDERVPMADRAIALSSSLILRGRDLGVIRHYINRLFLMLSPLLIYFRSSIFPRNANMVRQDEMDFVSRLSEKYVVLGRFLLCILYTK